MSIGIKNLQCKIIVFARRLKVEMANGNTYTPKGLELDWMHVDISRLT